MKKNSSGHRAAKTPPAVKQDAPPAFTGSIYNQTQRLKLRQRIEEEEYRVEGVLALSPEAQEHLSDASKLAHRMRTGMLAYLKEELAALNAAETNHEEDAI